MFGLSKLYETLIIIGIIVIGVYFVAIKPHYDLKESRAELDRKNAAIEVIKDSSTKEVFETKHESIKKTLQDKRISNEKTDLNLSRGKHIIILP